jgi:hypothetical protein
MGALQILGLGMWVILTLSGQTSHNSEQSLGWWAVFLGHEGVFW